MENLPAKQINLTTEEIKKYICPEATDQEAYFFLKLCDAQGLNPFLREAYLIKYGTEKATIVTGKDTFTKRADRIPEYDGFKAGIIILSNKEVVYRQGSFFVDGENLLGGWAEVFRKDRTQPFRNEVSMAEYARYKKDGTLMNNWKSMPATMIRKVALVQSLREAFPDELGGISSPEEMPIDVSAMPVYTYGEPPKIPIPAPPIQEPQKKTSSQSESKSKPESAMITIKNVTTQIKKKDGTAMKSPLYIILSDAGVEYKTFSESLMKIANKEKEAGIALLVEFEKGPYGNTIIENGLNYVDQPPEDRENAQS